VKRNINQNKLDRIQQLYCAIIKTHADIHLKRIIIQLYCAFIKTYADIHLKRIIMVTLYNLKGMPIEEWHDTRFLGGSSFHGAILGV